MKTPDEKITWRDHQYGQGQTLRCAFFDISVQWDATRSQGSKEKPFVVSVAGHRLNARFDEMGAAKKHAVTVAEKWLAAARKTLKEAGNMPPSNGSEDG